MATARVWYLDAHFKDIAGLRSGRLVAVSPAERTSYWNCLCNPAWGGCGREKVVRAIHIVTGATRSCGCLVRDLNVGRSTHGQARTAEYNVWNTMIQRCHNPQSTNWSRYGRRGIRVCKRWRDDFAAFLADVGPRPGPGYTLERKNNNGNYEPGNVLYATKKEQANNKRNNRLLEFQGRIMTLQQWADEVGLEGRTIWKRLHRRWSVERALTEPEHQANDPVLVIGDEALRVSEWAARRGLDAYLVKKRLGRGWTAERALDQAVQKRQKSQASA